MLVRKTDLFTYIILLVCAMTRTEVPSFGVEEGLEPDVAIGTNYTFFKLLSFELQSYYINIAT